MASTRNRNTREDYCLEKNKQQRYNDFQDYKYSRHNYDPKTPGFGYLPAQINGKDLSHNYVNIESQLFGIGANDLENPRQQQVPDYKHMNELTRIEQEPVIEPRPFYIEPNQRHLA